MELNDKGRLVSIDIKPPYTVCIGGIDKLHLLKRWEIIQSDDLEIDWMRSIDYLFIDTKHTTEHVFNELRKFAPYVKHYIVVHDTKMFHDVLVGVQMFVAGAPWIATETDAMQYGLTILQRKLTI